MTRSNADRKNRFIMQHMLGLSNNVDPFLFLSNNSSYTLNNGIITNKCRNRLVNSTRANTTSPPFMIYKMIPETQMYSYTFHNMSINRFVVQGPACIAVIIIIAKMSK